MGARSTNSGHQLDHNEGFLHSLNDPLHSSVQSELTMHSAFVCSSPLSYLRKLKAAPLTTV